MTWTVQKTEQMAVKVTLWTERAEGTESSRGRATTGSLRGQEASPRTGLALRSEGKLGLSQADRVWKEVPEVAGVPEPRCSPLSACGQQQ